MWNKKLGPKLRPLDDPWYVFDPDLMKSGQNVFFFMVPFIYSKLGQLLSETRSTEKIS